MNDLLAAGLVLIGAVLMLLASIGVLRMPDVFTRMHAVSVIDTLGIGLLILGMAMQAGLSLVTLKLFFLLALVFFTWPVVTHALAQACLHSGVEPQLAEDRRDPTRRGTDAQDQGRPSSN